LAVVYLVLVTMHALTDGQTDRQTDFDSKTVRICIRSRTVQTYDVTQLWCLDAIELVSLQNYSVHHWYKKRNDYRLGNNVRVKRENKVARLHNMW